MIKEIFVVTGLAMLLVAFILPGIDVHLSIYAGVIFGIGVWS